MSEELMKRTTITEMVNAWRVSVEEIRQAYALLQGAEERLKSVFMPESYLFDLSRDRYDRSRYDKPDELIKDLKKDAWRALLDRMELRRFLSVQRTKELDTQLETGEGLPEIEETQILAMMQETLTNIPNLIEEAVKEVFDYLRPPHSKYKTNTEFEIGKRVVLAWALEGRHGGGFYVNHYREANIRAIDNVFHALDGKGMVKTHRGPLIDAICQCKERQGETVYFKFRCFRNQNLHLEFKRLDLVDKLNQVAGGLRLKP